MKKKGNVLKVVDKGFMSNFGSILSYDMKKMAMMVAPTTTSFNGLYIIELIEFEAPIDFDGISKCLK
jgi:hypothetical protein